MKNLDKNKLILPIGIIIGCLILGFFLLEIQKNKQESIERQQVLKTEQSQSDQFFSNNLKCQDLLKDLQDRWNNIVGIYYQGNDNMFAVGKNTCIVKYKKNGIIEEAPIENMQDD